MESKINYTLVGLFVVLLLSGLISSVYWLGQYGDDEKFEYYHAYMSESVAGLSTDASVKYRGVNVGTVEHIELNPNNSEQVALLLKIKHNTPVKLDTTAMLKSFGLTGLSYVELEGGSHASPLLKESSQGIPEIATRPSTFVRLEDSMGKLANKSALALDKFNQLLSDENLISIASTLNNVNVLTKDVNLLVQDTREQVQGFRQLIDNGVDMEQQAISTFEKFAAASISMKSMANTLKINSGDISRNVSQDIQQSAESFNQLLSELEILVHHLSKTAQSFGDNPIDLLLKQSQPKLGPGEAQYHEQ